MPSSANSNASSGPSGWEPPSVERLQELLPQYEITALIGRGGMGAVYRGVQSTLGRNVAIKLLPESLQEDIGDASFAERFKLEARSMASLDHPAIISVHDFGQTSEGHLYFVMEFVDGMDLQQYLRASGGKLEADAAVAIVSHVLDALDYAHKKGIVHRDIKPANVLINSEGRVKIADFGLAKEIGAEGVGLTMSNVAMGTPDFIAPEALLDSATSDGRADLYAVGVMLYQMLTGKLPRGMFKLPSEEDARFDPRIDDIIAEAMEPNPEHRFSAAKDFRKKLDELSTEPMSKIEGRSTIQRRGAKTQDVTPAVKGGLPANTPSGKGGLWVGIAAAIAVVGGGAWFALKPGGEEPSTAGLSADSGSKVTKAFATPKAGPTGPPSAPAPASTVTSKEPTFLPPVPTPSEPVAPAAESDTPPMVATASPSPKPVPSEVDSPTQPVQSAISVLASLTGFQTRIANYQKARAAQLGDLTTKYRAALGATHKEATQSGNLAHVEAIQEAMDRADSYATSLEFLPSQKAVETLPSLSALDAKAPDSLKKLRSIFDSETTRIESQLSDALHQSLNALQSSLVKAGDIDRAKALSSYRDEISELFGVQSAGSALASTPPPGSTSVAIDLMNRDDWRRYGQDAWKVEQGAFTSQGDELGYLYRTLPFDEFELEGEFMADKDANGGILFAAASLPAAKKFIDTGFQFQLCGSVMKDQKKTGTIMMGGGGGIMFSVDKSPIADGAWGRFKIRYDGNTIQGWVQGQKIFGVAAPPTSVRGRGQMLALEQMGTGGKLGYRNLRVTSLNPTLSSSPPPSAAPKPTAKGNWASIFDGRDLSGWKVYGDAANFSISAGALKAQIEGKGASYLFWTGTSSQPRTLRDFELRMLVRAEGRANSGIYFHCDATTWTPGSHPSVGHEIQLATDAAVDLQKTGALYQVQPPFSELPDQSDWFEMIITVQGKHVRCTAGGRLLLDYTEPEDYAPPAKGPGKRFRKDGGAIAIQANSNGGAWYFKRIELRALD